LKNCVACNNPISDRRLAALPNATHCIVCAQEVEMCRPIISRNTNMERLGNVITRTDDYSYYIGRKIPRFSTGGIGQAMELGN
jgi:hypothetical protein